MDDQQRTDLDQLLIELDDPDPLVRQEAAIGLGDHCRKDHPCIDMLIQSLQSPDQTLHDRTCSAWALGRIKAKAGEVVPILLALIEKMRDHPEADELRSYAAEAIERLTDDTKVLTTVARRCLEDRYWKFRMHGLFLVERLIKRQPDLRAADSAARKG
jgi:HEAT repeat protein